MNDQFQKILPLVVDRLSSILLSVLPAIITMFYQPNTKIAFILILYLCWVIGEIFQESWDTNLIASKKSYDKNSRRYMIICRHLSLWSSVAYIKFISFNIEIPLLFIMAIILIILGIGLRFIAIKALKKYFTMEIDAYEQQTIVQSGLYKYIRHPSYLGIIFIFISFPLIAGSLMLSLVILLLTTSVVIYRINLEEALLTAKTKNIYACYAKRTYRLFPFIY